MQDLVLKLQNNIEQLQDYKIKYERSHKQSERAKLQFAHSEKIRKNQQSLIELQSQKINKLKNELKKQRAENKQLNQIINSYKDFESANHHTSTKKY